MPVLTSTAELHADNYPFLQRHVYVETGIVLEEDKHYLFECRLVPIVRRLGLKTIDDLCGLLQGSQSGDVSRQVVEAMTTNENLFFPRPRPI
jgi:chemotaxis protein methyltransferase CheR